MTINAEVQKNSAIKMPRTMRSGLGSVVTDWITIPPKKTVPVLLRISANLSSLPSLTFAGNQDR